MEPNNMNPAIIPTAEIEQVKEKPRIRNIELDEIPEVNNFVEGIMQLDTEEKLNAVSTFIKSKLKSALPVNSKELSDVERAKINTVFDQKTPKKLSECLLVGYGVCLDYNALGKVIFDKLGIPAEFKVGDLGRGPKHTYLDIEIDGAWQIFDPFAEVFMQERGSSSKLFSTDYYTGSRTAAPKK